MPPELRQFDGAGNLAGKLKWRKLERRGNVQDRRRRPGRAATGAIGGGLGVIVIIVAMLFSGGNVDIGDVLGQLDTAGSGSQQPPAELTAEEVGYADFAGAVLGDLDAVWDSIFTAAELQYPPPTMVLFRGFTESGCGGASEQIGPHYCPLDSTIYIDETFFDEVLERRLDAPGGDFAEAYVMAHEVGHHVQNALGISDDVRAEQRANPEEANELSVKLELQADCFAGIWAHTLAERGGVLDAGDIREALEAAAAVGDDRIQEKTTGMINEETWTHGSSEDRVAWFTTGYETGNADACDTFD